jgi:hypothetical protein
VSIDNLVLILGAGASCELGSNHEPLPLMPDWNNILRVALDDKQPGLSNVNDDRKRQHLSTGAR